jgi:hypothetical protein
LVVHVRATDQERLRLLINKNVRAIEKEFVSQEMNNAIARLRNEHDAKTDTLIRSMFGVRLWVPREIGKWKKGQDFLWLSNDDASSMQNICIYRYEGTGQTKEEMVSKRDSVMRRNLPGEAEGSYMETVTQSVAAKKSDDKKLLRGLWAMNGAAMGGPFVCIALEKGDSTLVAEAFVYAPSMKKRNMLRRLEASLYTLKNEQ